MRINSIQSYNNNSNPNFGLNFYPTQSLQHAIYESRDLMTPVLYTEKNRKFLQKFCNSLAKIKKSKKADSISLYYSDFYKKYIVIEYTKNPNNVKKCEDVVTFDRRKAKNDGLGKYFHSDDGASAMKTLIKYAKTITDVPRQRLKLSKEELQKYPYEALLKDYENSVWQLYY